MSLCADLFTRLKGVGTVPQANFRGLFQVAATMSSQRVLRRSTSGTNGTTASAKSILESQVGQRTMGKRKNEAGTRSLIADVQKISQPRKRHHKGQNHAPISKKARIETTPEFQNEPKNNGNITSIDRPAEPHSTNAPLVTPQGSRYLTYTEESLYPTPQADLPRPTTTTGNILEQACAHLIRMEPKIQPLIERHYCRVFCPEGLAEECDPFKSLCSGIMAQQVSGAAASSIKKKFISLFRKTGADLAKEALPFPTPTQVAACSVPFLRQAGLSERKAEYIKGLAVKFSSGELNAPMLINASDNEILEKLTAIRGLGKWSVEMFACFGLKRMDILSTGDLGVQYEFLLIHPEAGLIFNPTGEVWRLSLEETLKSSRPKGEGNGNICPKMTCSSILRSSLPIGMVLIGRLMYSPSLIQLGASLCGICGGSRM